MRSKSKVIKDILAPKQPQRKSKNSPLKSSPRQPQNIYINSKNSAQVLSPKYIPSRNAVTYIKKEQASIHSNSSTKSNQSFSTHSENSRVLSEYLTSDSYATISKAEPYIRKRIPSSYRNSLQIDHPYIQENLKHHKNPNFRDITGSPAGKMYSCNNLPSQNKLIMIEFEPVKFAESNETNIEINYIPMIPSFPSTLVSKSIIQGAYSVQTEKESEQNND